MVGISTKRKKPNDPVILRMKKQTLDNIRDGKVEINGPLGVVDMSLFSGQCLHVPTEIDYLIGQTVEAMDLSPENVSIGYYEGAKEIRFEIFPPRGV